MSSYVILFVIAAALWYFLFVRMSSYRGHPRGKVLYWTGDFFFDRSHPLGIRILVALANVVVLYVILIAADWFRSQG